MGYCKKVLEAAPETFIHIDQHKDQITWCALDTEGNELGVGKIATKCRGKIVDWITQWPRPVKVSIEAVGFYRWLWLLLEPHTDYLHLADAAGLRRMSERNIKTDFRDARNGAHILRMGRLPESFALGEPLYSLRQRLRHRHDLARRTARLKSSLKRICLRSNLQGPRKLSGARAVSYFDAYGGRLHEMDRERWLDLTDQMLLLERELARVEREFHLQIESLPEIHEDSRRLTTAPGVGVLTAVTVLTETGGLSRFDTGEQVACYSGLTTRTFSSDTTIRHGSISKAGPPNLRWVLQQAAWAAIRSNSHVRKIHNRISRRAGSKKAAVAIARRLLIWLWAMHRTKTDWNPQCPGAREVKESA
jgi:transposase